MLNYYKSSNAIRNKKMKQKYKDDLIAIMESEFENAPNVFYGTDSDCIEFEYEYGSNIFKKVPVARVDTVKDFDTGIVVGDDFKVFLFKPTFPQLHYGMKFRWKNNYWLVINTNNYEDNNVSAEVRRCNNVLRFFDQSGNRIYEPCIMDSTLRFTNNNENSVVVTGNNEQKIWCQRNSRTTGLKPNDRFLFGTPDQRVSFRIEGGGIKNFLNTDTFDENSSTLIEFYMEYYQINEEVDDLVNGFANVPITSVNQSQNNGIYINPNVDYILQGDTLNLECFLYINGEQQENSVAINDISNGVPSNKYTINIIDDNHFNIINKGMFLDAPILIQCSSGEYTKVFSYKLRGLY